MGEAGGRSCWSRFGFGRLSRDGAQAPVHPWWCRPVIIDSALGTRYFDYALRQTLSIWPRPAPEIEPQEVLTMFSTHGCWMYIECWAG